MFTYTGPDNEIKETEKGNIESYLLLKKKKDFQLNESADPPTVQR